MPQWSPSASQVQPSHRAQAGRAALAGRVALEPELALQVAGLVELRPGTVAGLVELPPGLPVAALLAALHRPVAVEREVAAVPTI